MGKWLVRQRAEILIVFGLALLGSACGWLLRDQLMKRDDEMRSETSDLQTPLSTHRVLARDPPTSPLLPPGEPDRLAGNVDRRSGASVHS